MDLPVAYRGRSAVVPMATGLAIALAPNLRRDRVSFSGTLKDPLRFREAISALHDVVISDLKFKPKDHTAYQQYLEQQKQREAAIHSSAAKAKREELKSHRELPLPPGLEAEFRRLRKHYWSARDQYANYLSRHDPELWRLLLPCDPVITVAPDVLFFECFSADESSYGCLTVNRAAFATEHDVALGTTNVDYSWALFEHFQRLRSYRETRFVIDSTGFEVQTEQSGEYREEKIDLPNSWLRGFLQLQAAMSMPMRRATITREGLYNVLAWLKRHKAKRSPRALRFELTPGKPIELVLEPWEKRLVLHDTKYQGQSAETIRTWGRDRLQVLARLLPLIDSVDVFLLGSGLPSFWVVRMGEMVLTLGLSGWTANDWTGGSALDQLMPPVEIDDALLERIAGAFRTDPAATFQQICERTMVPAPKAAAALNRLALLGTVIHDLSAGVYRWRQIMPLPLTLSQVGPENPESVAARQLVQGGKVTVLRDEKTPSGLRLLAGRLPGRNVEMLIDGDGRIMRGKCNCSHHFQFGLRKGPCQHLQALRNKVVAVDAAPSLDSWYTRFWK